jgi:putative hydrolase of HD superfamily
VREDAFLEFLASAGALKRTARAGWARRSLPLGESVADHSFRCALIALVLGDARGLDTGKLMGMALLHDLPEALTGDITPSDGIRDSEKRALEDHAMARILGDLPPHHHELWLELRDRQTPEASLMADIDKFELGLQAWEFGERIPEFDAGSLIQYAQARIEDPMLSDLLCRLTGCRGGGGTD